MEPGTNTKFQPQCSYTLALSAKIKSFLPSFPHLNVLLLSLSHSPLLPTCPALPHSLKPGIRKIIEMKTGSLQWPSPGSERQGFPSSGACQWPIHYSLLTPPGYSRNMGRPETCPHQCCHKYCHFSSLLRENKKKKQGEENNSICKWDDTELRHPFAGKNKAQNHFKHPLICCSVGHCFPVLQQLNLCM